MKKLFPFAVLSFVAVPLAASATPVIQESGQVSYSNGIKLTAGLGFLTGEADEYVYWPSQGGHTASKLTWKTDSLFLAGVGAELPIGSRITVKGNVWTKTANGEAKMDDYDYLDVNSTDWTDWSTHDDTEVSGATFLDINVDWSFLKSGGFSVSAIGGVKYDRMEWEASNGSYIYSENGGYHNSTGTFNGLGITYEQEMTTPYLGIGVAAEISQALSFSGRFIYSPLVQATATDQHHYRGLVTEDEADSGNMFALDLSGLWHFTEKMGIEATLNYTKYDTMDADSTWDYGYYSTSIEDGGGIDSEYTSMMVKFVYEF